MKWNIPNILTLLRLVAAPGVAVMFLYFTRPYADALAMFLFIAAAVTDWFDGYLARAWGQETKLGTMLDPIADKMILASLLVLALVHGMFGPVGTGIALLMLLREFWIGGLREGLGKQSALLAASRAAKWKTAFQFAGLIVLFADSWASLGLGWIAELALAPALVLSLISAWDYSRRGIAALMEED